MSGSCPECGNNPCLSAYYCNVVRTSVIPGGFVDLMRQFDTGATRTADETRYDPEGFLSPIVIERFCQYMARHRVQADGNVRASDNWQKGMPLESYAKGLCRHFLHFWTRHRGWPVLDEKAAADIEEDICAQIFNLQGYLHELLVKKLKETK